MGTIYKCRTLQWLILGSPQTACPLWYQFGLRCFCFIRILFLVICTNTASGRNNCVFSSSVCFYIMHKIIIYYFHRNSFFFQKCFKNRKSRSVRKYNNYDVWTLHTRYVFITTIYKRNIPNNLPLKILRTIIIAWDEIVCKTLNSWIFYANMKWKPAAVSRRVLEMQHGLVKTGPIWFDPIWFEPVWANLVRRNPLLPGATIKTCTHCQMQRFNITAVRLQ